MYCHIHMPPASTWRYVGMWQKFSAPHPIRRRETMQTQKATAPNCHLVVFLEPPHPHKENKQLANNRCNQTHKSQTDGTAGLDRFKCGEFEYRRDNVT